MRRRYRVGKLNLYKIESSKREKADEVVERSSRGRREVVEMSSSFQSLARMSRGGSARVLLGEPPPRSGERKPTFAVNRFGRFRAGLFAELWAGRRFAELWAGRRLAAVGGW